MAAERLPPPPGSASGKRRGGNPPVPYVPSDPSSMPVVDSLEDALGGINIAGLSPEDTIPEEVTAFMQEHDFSDRHFKTILKRVPDGTPEGSRANSSFVKDWNRAVPSLQYIAMNYGPGHYCLIITWNTYAQDDDGKKQRKAESQMIDVEIDSSCEADHLEYLREKKASSAIKLREKLRTQQLGKQLDDSILGPLEGLGGTPPPPPQQSAKEYLTELMEMNRSLGLIKPEGSGMKGLIEQITPALPFLVPLVTSMMNNGRENAERMQQQQNAMMTMMIQQSDRSTGQLIEIMKSSQNTNTGSGIMKEMTDMMMSAIDFKSALAETKETPFDKIIGMVGAVLPQLMAVAAMNKQQQAADPRVIMAKTYVAHNPEIQSVLQDPAKTAEMVRQLDEVYGWEQTDQIIGVMGISRPAECPREDDMRLPPAERGEDSSMTSPVQPDQP